MAGLALLIIDLHEKVDGIKRRADAIWAYHHHPPKTIGGAR